MTSKPTGCCTSPAEQLDAIAAFAGIGAVKYADLSTPRVKDYTFDLERMVALNGNTGVYLQYAHARIRSILAKPQACPGRWTARCRFIQPSAHLVCC